MADQALYEMELVGHVDLLPDDPNSRAEPPSRAMMHAWQDQKRV